jgi:hypothetical protein
VDRSERRSRSGRRARRLPEAKAGRAAERFGFQRKRAPFRSRAALASWCAPRLNYRARTEGPAPGAMRIAAATAAALLAALIAPRSADAQATDPALLPPAAPLEGRVWFDEDLNRAAAVGTWGRAVDYCSAQVRSRHAQACPNAPQHALRAARGGRPMPRL